jgi:membrane protease YdiL (CAAX protease family)
MSTSSGADRKVRVAGALGEEIGWCGFLAPALFQLRNRNFTATVLIDAVIWASWHAPIIFFSSYNNPGVPRWYSFGCFVILIIGSTTIADWLRLRSGSLWTGVLLHNSHNIFVQVIFTPLTVNTGKTQYFIDEFGIVLPLVMFAFAIYLWMRRKERNLQKSGIRKNEGADIQAQML